MKRVMMIGFDGSDPFVVKRMIENGKLPNFQKIITQGVTTEDYSMLGAFPSVTPPNWATLATGNWPITHGITDYWNHTLGKDLATFEGNWDSRRVESELVWETAVKNGMRAIVLNYCGAWPPRFPSEKLVVIDGTGVVPFMRTHIDGSKLIRLDKNFDSLAVRAHKVENTSDDCIVTKEQLEQFGTADETAEENIKDAFSAEFDPMYDHEALIMDDALVEYIKMMKASGGSNVDEIDAPLTLLGEGNAKFSDNTLTSAIPFNNNLTKRYFVVSGRKNDGKVLLFKDKKLNKPLGEASVGEWSNWVYDVMYDDETEVKCAYKFRVLELDPENGKCKIFVTSAINLENDNYVYPKDLTKKIYDAVGPMMPLARYVDAENEKLANEVAMEGFEQIIDWHADVTNYLMDLYDDWQLFYTHIHPCDLINHAYIDKSIPGADEDWERYRSYVEAVYEWEDRYLGDILQRVDDETSIIVVSDHGAVPKGVGVESGDLSSGQGIMLKVLEELGYTKSYRTPNEKTPHIDWSKTRAVVQRGNYIYVNLKGRDPQGIVEPEDYHQLIEDIISDLYAYRDPRTGRRVVSWCMDREEMLQIGIGGEHVGDIFVQQQCCFIDQHNGAPTTCSNEGYSLNNMFMMAGAGIKSGVILQRPVRANEIVPTICELLDCPMSADAEGGPIYQALDKYAN